MELKQIQAIKDKIKPKIERGDFVTLSKILEASNRTLAKRYERNSLNEVLLMQKIVIEREKLIVKLKKKNMRINNKKNFKKCIELHLGGVRNKDIAIELGHTEKTICIWIQYAKSLYPIKKETYDNLIARLEEISANKDTPIVDIYNLSNSIYMIRNQVFLKGSEILIDVTKIKSK